MRKMRMITAIILVFMMILPTIPAAAEDTGTTNLALGRTVTSVSYTGIKGNVFGADTGVDQHGLPGVVNERQMEYRLTDGNFGTGMCYDGKHAGFYRNGGRSLSVYFDQTDTINEINIRMLEDKAWGIWLPSEVHFSISDDGGQTWKYLGSVDKLDVTDITTNTHVNDLFDPANTNKTTKYYKFEMTGLNYQANAVKLDFDVPVFVFADEMQVIGKNGAPRAPVNNFVPFTAVNAFPAPVSEQVKGVRDDYLAYTGWSGGVQYLKTGKELLPAIAYLDKNGKPVDWMFDGFTFMTYAQSSAGRDMEYISGNANDQTKAGNKADWQEYIDLLFNNPDQQLNALENTVGEVKAQLKAPDYKVHVKIAIPDPVPYQTSFGEVDGRNLNFSAAGRTEQDAYADRLAAVKWYVDTALAAWESKGYQNIVLDGFYWYEEEIFNGQESDMQVDLVKAVTSYVHDVNKVIYWIPFNQAGGYSKWHDFGFDFAVLQPNLPFGNYPAIQPTLTASLAKLFGLGVEMEIHWFGLAQNTYRDMYLEYLNQGITAGYMGDCYQAWYLGTDSLQQMYYSGVSSDRELYDYTYQFIKGTYTEKILSTQIRNLALNKPVERVITDPKGNNRQQDSEVGSLGLLVDGNLGTSDSNDKTHVKFVNGGGREVILDLVGTQTVKSMDMVFANDNKSGSAKGVTNNKNLPQKVEFLISNDGGENWVSMGKAELSAAKRTENGVLYQISGLNVTAGKVKAIFDVPDGWVSAGEFEVMGKPGMQDGAITPNPFDNLSLNKPITHEIFTPDPSNTNQLAEADKLPILNDGVLASDGWWDGAHVGFLWGGGRSITIDLQAVNTVKQMSILLSQDDSSGVYLPPNVRFYLSNDGGATWTKVGTVDASKGQAYGADFKLELKHLNYTANKVKIEFDVGVDNHAWVFASEIEVYGKKGVQDGATAPVDAK